MKYRQYIKWIAALMALASCNAIAAIAQYSSQLDLTNPQYPVNINGATGTVAADIVRVDLGSGWDGQMDIQVTTSSYSTLGTTLGFALATDPNDALYNDPSAFLALSDTNADVTQFFNDNVVGWEIYSWGSNYIAPDATNNITGSLNPRNFDPTEHYYAFLAGGSLLPTTIDIQLDISDGNDVSAVPVPAAVWLFGSGMIGLLSVNRRKRVSNEECIS
ncbi:MAG: VPLPA-CTERM sorting domain-containing protein [Candidatus Thiodiazotropha weberae]|nr:VPLPA-CTERM sorting domain-containing protein [Candidatus Thiodiazotropha weberae]